MSDTKFSELEQEDYDYYKDNVNPYTKKENSFSAFEILEEGVMPVLNNAGDKTRCVVEVSNFVKRNSILFSNRPTHAQNVAKLLRLVDLPHRVLFFQKLSLGESEYLQLCPELEELIKYE